MEKVNKELILVEGIVKWSRIIEVLKATNTPEDLRGIIYKNEIGEIVIQTCLFEGYFEAPKINKNIWKK